MVGADEHRKIQDPIHSLVHFLPLFPPVHPRLPIGQADPSVVLIQP